MSNELRYTPDHEYVTATYRGFNIYPSSYSPFGRASDWTWTHDSYDGADDSSDNRTGFGRDVNDCVTAIDVWYADNEETE